MGSDQSGEENALKCFRLWLLLLCRHASTYTIRNLTRRILLHLFITRLLKNDSEDVSFFSGAMLISLMFIII
jgi:hypothetical protein